MTEAIIVALITVAGSIIVQVMISRANTRDLYAKLDKQSEISDQRIQGEIDVIKTEIRQLTAQVEKHNQVIDRTYALENRMGVAEERISDANHRINELRDRPG